MPWPKTGIIHYHAQLELPDKGCVIKVLIVCNNWEFRATGLA